MQKTCANCKCNINTNNSVYKGFDCTFCSTFCRTKMWTKVYAMDDNFKHPEIWPNKEYKFNDVKIWTQTKSINNFNTKIINENNYYKKRNICNLILIDNSYFSYMINSATNFKEYIKYMMFNVF